MLEKYIQNYVISLNTASSRRAHIEEEFGKPNIPFEFFDAVNLNNLSGNISKSWISHLENSDLTLGEKGCLLSHVALWEKCINDNLPYICIFEDDIILSKDSSLFLKDLTWIEKDLNLNGNFVIKLETFLMFIEQEKMPGLLTYENRELNKLKSTHYGTAGYIISNQAAQYFLNYIKNLPSNNIYPIDNIIFSQRLSDNNLHIFQLEPAICIQELQLNKRKSKLGSQLEEQRRDAVLATRPKINLWKKLLGKAERMKRRKLEKAIRLEKKYRIVEFL